MQVDFADVVVKARAADVRVPCVAVATLEDAQAALIDAEGGVVLTLAYAPGAGFAALAAGCEILAADVTAAVVIAATDVGDMDTATRAINAGCHSLIVAADAVAACRAVADTCGVTVVAADDPVLGDGAARMSLGSLRPWTPVDHVIVYNVLNVDDGGVRKLMAEGRRVLSAIPGVRWIYTGESVTEGSKFQFSWLVRFVHADVIASYRDHPAHVAYADNWFRPVAGDRITIDFRVVGD